MKWTLEKRLCVAAHAAGGIAILVGCVVLAGWLRLQGQRIGWDNQEFGTALLTTSNIGVLSLLIWWNARSLGRADAERRQRPQATIEFGRSCHNGDSSFFVRDDGVGFDMQYVNKLFTSFQRLHRTNIAIVFLPSIVSERETRSEGELYEYENDRGLVD